MVTVSRAGCLLVPRLALRTVLLLAPAAHLPRRRRCPLPRGCCPRGCARVVARRTVVRRPVSSLLGDPSATVNPAPQAIPNAAPNARIRAPAPALPSPALDPPKCAKRSRRSSQSKLLLLGGSCSGVALYSTRSRAYTTDDSTRPLLKKRVAKAALTRIICADQRRRPQLRVSSGVRCAKCGGRVAAHEPAIVAIVPLSTLRAF